MSRFLLAWELGANFGHLARDLPIARHLRVAGHQVLFAVRDTRTAAEFLDRDRFAYVQTPIPQARARLAKPPGSYAELLLAEGWADRLSLVGRVRAWHALFALARPHAVIADHAPTALLAAYVAGIKRIACGSGFEIPLAVAPLPAIRPWENLTDERLRESEAMALKCVNEVVDAFAGKPLPRLVDLFSDNSVLLTFAELDHYGERGNANYVGSIHGIGHAAIGEWPKAQGPRLLAYLRPGQRGSAEALGTLRVMSCRAVAVLPGSGERSGAMHGASHLAIHRRPVACGPLLAKADAAICHGGAGIVAEALLAGVPLLVIPTTVEQYMAGKRVERLGAGIVLDGDVGQQTVTDSLKSLISQATYRQAALRFADTYRGASPDRSAAIAAESILSACGVAENPVTEQGICQS